MTIKVLLVDDEKDFLTTLEERMTIRGMAVRATTSAREALKILKVESFDVMVLDLMMPEMDGIDLLKTVKIKQPELQIILLTGHGTIEKGMEAMRLGAADFIEKPADIEILLEKIRKARARKMILMERQTEAMADKK
jgi:DNA-binding NtrC family response regulator